MRHAPTTLRAGALLLVASASLATSMARAADPGDDVARREAAARFQEGLALHDLGKDDEARVKYEQAFAVLHTPRILFNLARSEQLSGHEIDAITHYRAFLALPEAQTKAPELLDKARQHIAELTPRVGLLVVATPKYARVVVDGEALPGDMPPLDPVAVRPGQHHVEAIVDGRTIARDVDAPAGQTVQVDLMPPPPPPTPAFGSGRAPSSSPSPPIIPPHDDTSPGASARPRNVTALVIAGVGVIAEGVAIGFAVASSSAGSRVNQLSAIGSSDSCTGTVSQHCTDLQDAISSHHTDAQMATGFAVSGGVLLAGALVTWLVWPSSSAKPSTGSSTWIVPTLGGVQAGGSF